VFVDADVDVPVEVEVVVVLVEVSGAMTQVFEIVLLCIVTKAVLARAAPWIDDPVAIVTAE
jgi:hypothetical protein